MDMQSQNTNPFLIHLESSQIASNNLCNPFDTTAPAQLPSSNPFVQQFTPSTENYISQDVDYIKANSTSTNPFSAFFATEIHSNSAPTSIIENSEIDFMAKNNDFSTIKKQISLESSTNISNLLDDSFSNSNISLNTNLYQSTITQNQENKTKKQQPPFRPPPPPSRPPPPRSIPPKETKDLILSVTGALEATSSDLLDRLQATRTPSPIPLHDLNSPSPVMMEVNDLLGDEIEMPPFSHGEIVHTASNIQQEALNIFDAIANLSEEKEINIQPSITPPSRPPPPVLPIQYESDVTNLFADQAQIKSETKLSNFDDEHELIEIEKMKETSHEYSFVNKPQIRKNFITDYNIIHSEQNSSLDGYIPTRKASHDMSSIKVQTIPTHKKYSLDYSAFSNQTAVTGKKDDKYSKVNNSFEQVQEDNNILEISKISDNLNVTPIIRNNHGNNDILDVNNDNEEPNLVFEEATIEKSNLTYDTTNHSNLNKISQTNQEDEVDEFSINDMHTKFSPEDEFDKFQEKFESCKEEKQYKVGAGDHFDPFGDSSGILHYSIQDTNSIEGFGNEDTFDEFLARNQPQFNDQNNSQQETVNLSSWFETDRKTSSSLNISNNDNWSTNIPTELTANVFATINKAPAITNKTDSSETPPTPLFDEDISQPLEPFPRSNYIGPGWEMQIRYPIRKKFTGQRFWKKVFVKLVYQGETPHLELVNKDDGRETLHHEWPLQPCYAISDIGAQQYDQYGKIFTVKIQFVVYKERPGVRPGQVTKAERITNKLSQFAAYAIQGDYQGVKEFGSDLKKLGLPVEHSPQISLICKLGSHNYEDMKQFSACVEDALFRLPAHRDNININYKMEEVQITAVDELYVEQNASGSVIKQIARVRLFFLGFLTGMPDIEIGVNDLWRQGKEVVGRHDIIPVVTEEWIRLENVEFHSCIQQDVYEECRTIKLKPPDACYLELMRFRVRPPKNRELPLQLKTVFRICGNKVDIYADIIVPGFTSRKLGQIPCEDVAVRIPIPECWIYLFRVEKHFRYGSVKSAHRRTGKIKGIERFLGAVDTLETHLIEVTSGHAKYEHHHRAIVWRMSRLPKEGQGAYTTHNLVCHLSLTSYDQVPDELAKYCFVEFTMPITQVSHMTVRSVSISNSDSDSPPEKYVRHLARHEYKVEIECTHSESTNDYIAATITKPKLTPQIPPSPSSKDREAAESESESD